jgi:hypothetical protein
MVRPGRVCRSNAANRVGSFSKDKGDIFIPDCEKTALWEFPWQILENQTNSTTKKPKYHGDEHGDKNN